MWCFDAFFDVSLYKLLNKQSSCWWFQMSCYSCNIPIMSIALCAEQGPVWLTVFPTQLKFDGNFISLSPRFWYNDRYKILYMARQLCCHGMCKNLLQIDGQQQSYGKAKFPSNLNCGQKNVSETNPSTQTRLHASWCINDSKFTTIPYWIKSLNCLPYIQNMLKTNGIISKFQPSKYCDIPWNLVGYFELVIKDHWSTRISPTLDQCLE